jgi:serine/threonine-protein kinase
MPTGTPERVESDSYVISDDAPRRVGTTLAGTYELIRKMGEGGMGEIYEARHLRLGKRVAVKVLHLELSRSALMRQRFAREARIASGLESDHVVSIIDSGVTAESVPYYVMEYLHGLDLRQLLRSAKRIDPRRAISIVLDVAYGLRAAHDRALVHRDLKPENVFVVKTSRGGEQAKLLDFGVAHVGDEPSLARPGSVIGTLKYMAPEQIQGGPVDARSDLFSLAVILFECVTGHLPHEASSAEEQMFRLMNVTPADVELHDAALQRDLNAVLRRALARNPEDRFANASEFISALTRLSLDAHASPNGYSVHAPRSRETPRENGLEVTADEGASQLPRPARERRRGATTRFERSAAMIFGLLVGLMCMMAREGCSRPTAAGARANAPRALSSPSERPSPAGPRMNAEPNPTSTLASVQTAPSSTEVATEARPSAAPQDRSPGQRRGAVAPRLPNLPLDPANPYGSTPDAAKRH